MRSRKSETNENCENWDSGTYQTGPSSPPSGQSTAVTVLLMAVIFLGSMASALGVMNVRLLQELVQQENVALELDVATGNETVAAVDNFFHGDTPQEEPLPEEEMLQLRLGIRVQEINTLSRQYWDLTSGLEVIYVSSGSALRQGDILVAVNGRSLADLSDLCSVVDGASDGEVLQLSVLRVGQYHTVEVTVENP